MEKREDVGTITHLSTNGTLHLDLLALLSAQCRLTPSLLRCFSPLKTLDPTLRKLLNLPQNPTFAIWTIAVFSTGTFAARTLPPPAAAAAATASSACNQTHLTSPRTNAAETHASYTPHDFSTTLPIGPEPIRPEVRRGSEILAPHSSLTTNQSQNTRADPNRLQLRTKRDSVTFIHLTASHTVQQAQIMRPMHQTLLNPPNESTQEFKQSMNKLSLIKYFKISFHLHKVFTKEGTPTECTPMEISAVSLSDQLFSKY
jgi:hypothetical protein